MKYIRIFSVLLSISLVLLFSCAGKKGSSANSGKETDKNAANSETMSGEKMGAESSEAGKGEAGLDKSSSMNGIEKVYFDFDDANLRTDARDTLKKDADVLKGNSGSSIQIEGHCDERGSSEYNLALGQRRAESIKKYLATLGISNQKMGTISYGEEKPLVEGHSEDAWSKNRRGEIAVK